MNTKKKTICIDFDGVIAQYNGDANFEQDKFGEPVEGSKEALKALKEEGFFIIVFTTRKNTAALRNYLKKHELVYDSINENPDQPEDSNKGKPIADIYLDDRAVCFRGEWEWTLRDIASFKPWEGGNKEKKFKNIFDDYRKYSKEVAQMKG